jgi:hypothetical protein
MDCGGSPKVVRRNRRVRRWRKKMRIGIPRVVWILY